MDHDSAILRNCLFVHNYGWLFLVKVVYWWTCCQ